MVSTLVRANMPRGRLFNECEWKSNCRAGSSELTGEWRSVPGSPLTPTWSGSLFRDKRFLRQSLGDPVDLRVGLIQFPVAVC